MKKKTLEFNNHYLPGKDIVGHDTYIVGISKMFAQRKNSRRLARAYGTSYTHCESPLDEIKKPSVTAFNRQEHNYSRHAVYKNY